jgi:anti-sigma factor RsiW
MTRCEEGLSHIDFFLDGELCNGELKLFEKHLAECPSCRAELEERRLFLEHIRSSRPLHVASAEFRNRIAQTLQQEQNAEPLPAREAPSKVVTIKPAGGSSKRQPWSRPLLALAASVLAAAGLSMLWSLSERQARANAFVETAITTHQREISGRLPIELQTNSEAEITKWFTQKVPFQFRLPDYSAGQKQKDSYTLRGARLVAFKGDYAAYVAYRIGAQPISLLVTSASSAIASGGEATMSRGIAFHSHHQDGLQVFTWSVHGLTYALVSSVTVPGRQSCVVCHANSRGKELLRGAKANLWYSSKETPRTYTRFGL